MRDLPSESMEQEGTLIRVAQEAADFLRALGYDEPTVSRFHAAAVKGDMNALQRQWFCRTLQHLPTSDELAPVYTNGTFPAPPPARGLGGKVMTGASILQAAHERWELGQIYGPANAASACPQLAEDIL